MSSIPRSRAPTVGWAVEQRRRAQQQRTEAGGQAEQRVIDAEVRDTRRVLTWAVRRRLGVNPVAFLDLDFLAVADLHTLYRAIVEAALRAGRADAVDLQMYHPATRQLEIVASRGFNAEFLAFFATVPTDKPTACTTAVAQRDVVVVDDVTRSAIFGDAATLEPMLAAGSRAVRSYPLLVADGSVGAVLSCHYHRPPTHEEAAVVATGAALALRWTASNARDDGFEVVAGIL